MPKELNAERSDRITVSSTWLSKSGPKIYLLNSEKIPLNYNISGKENTY